jgi:FG-GAP-like repeat
MWRRAMRWLVGPIGIALAFSAPAAGGSPVGASARVRDIGSSLGLPTSTTSWDVVTGDLTGDGVPDLVVSYHDRITFYANQTDALVAIFSDSAEGEDPHGCAAADVDGNGLADVYCTRGAGSGSIAKRNRLWVQQSPGVFVDEAEGFGVPDSYGRGRRAVFLDINHDPYPDLFVGNRYPRRDAYLSPNRTFLNEGGTHFVEARSAITREHGAECVQAVDFDGDGWQDLLVCGQRRVFLYRNEPGAGGRRFIDVSRRIFGRRLSGVVSARFADFDRDGRLDLALVRRHSFRILHRLDDGTVGHALLDSPLSAGTWVAVANIDGRSGPDALLVQGCIGDVNVDDVLILNDGHGRRFSRASVPPATEGCGDVAAAIDVDRDGMDEVVVLNGRPPSRPGPVQVLTMGSLLP